MNLINTALMNEMKIYTMNPKKYKKTNMEKIETSIRILDEYLLNDKNEGKELFEEFKKEYTSNNDLKNPIISTIYKTRADEQGLSATRLYKEIYFNEIIQNANDITDEDYILITLSRDTYKRDYMLSFEYQDKGFSTENLIGFFDTEIHTKKNNLSSTGKHGVGIKSLFYFINYMKIESNVIIEFNIDEKLEEDIEKIECVTSSLIKNDNWSEKKTKFTIKFSESKDAGEFNIGKLKQFINTCLENEIIDYEDIAQYFFGIMQDRMIFDIRGLLFTDKNKNKKSGIKKFIFKNDKDDILFTLSCDENTYIKNNQNSVCEAKIKFNEDEKQNYLLFTKEGRDEQQNFSVAFPKDKHISIRNRRYYETYYIPLADEPGIDFLVNSQYSNVSRTKLSDEETQKSKIVEKINNEILEVFKFMVSKECGQSELGIDISKLFHRIIDLDNELINIFYENKINNRYLPKYKDAAHEKKNRYLVYKRIENELFERKLIDQSVQKEKLIAFFQEKIVSDDCLTYSEDLFIEEIKSAYNNAFWGSNYKLRAVLNVIGNVGELIYWRITDNFPSDNSIHLKDTEVDRWHERLYSDKNSVEYITISFSLIGRYKLHPFINMSGKIVGASFYEYLFSENNTGSSIEQSEKRYETFQDKQKTIYGQEYKELKDRLWSLLVNRENDTKKYCKGNVFNKVKEYEFKSRWCKDPNTCSGYVCFYDSDHHSAPKLTYYNPDEFKVYDYKDSNTDSFGKDLSVKLIKKIIDDNELSRHIEIVDDKLMIVDYNFPLWKTPVSRYWKYECYATGVPSKCRLININFLKAMYTYSFEEFKFFVSEFIEKFIFAREYLKELDFKLYTKKNDHVLVNINISDLVDVFQFFYSDERYKNFIDSKNLNFYFSLSGNLSSNLCPNDLYEFIKNTTNKNVYVVQTNSVDASKYEIMFIQNNELYFLCAQNWYKVGTSIQQNNQDIVIIHNERVSSRDAISKVLNKVFQKDDVVNKCQAFISTKSKLSMVGEEYNSLSNRTIEINCKSRIYDYSVPQDNLTSRDIKKIITSRGNNNNKCCCCEGKLLNYNLIITNNNNENTNSEFPQIYEVVCKDCENILRKSLNATQLVKDNGESYQVIYECSVGNTHQSKKVLFKVNIPDGVLSLCRKNDLYS